MEDSDILDLAESQRYLVARAQLLEAGASGPLIQKWISGGRLIRRDHGVYQVDRRPQDWLDQVQTAVLAAGPHSLVSHRAAMRLWKLDGPLTALVELTVPFGHLPVPDGVIVHRTRRIVDEDETDGLPVTSPPRTLLDVASLLPSILVAKALDSAIRMGIASVDQIIRFVSERGGRGVKGTRRLRGIVEEYAFATSTDSGAESEALFLLRQAGVVEPVLQHEFITRNGPKRPDFYWPEKNKAIEVDGLDAHSSADALDADLARQNDLLDLGIELRRFSARTVRRDPVGFVDDVRRFLGS